METGIKLTRHNDEYKRMFYILRKLDYAHFKMLSRILNYMESNTPEEQAKITDLALENVDRLLYPDFTEMQFQLEKEF